MLSQRGWHVFEIVALSLCTGIGSAGTTLLAQTRAHEARDWVEAGIIFAVAFAGVAGTSLRALFKENDNDKGGS